MSSTGAQCTAFYSAMDTLLTCLPRCEALPENLDNPNANLRSQERMEFLLKTFDPGMIWDNYGVCDDVMVSVLSFFLPSCSETLAAIYTPLSQSGYP